MSKCLRCGYGGIFAKTNYMGLCKHCESEYNLSIARSAQIFIESNKIASTSNNLSTKLSRLKLALEQLYIMREFGNENYDVFKEIEGTTTIHEMIQVQEEAIDELCNIYSGIKEVILSFLLENGAKSKTEIINFINFNLQKIDASLPYDIEKTVKSMLDEMFNEQKVSKKKVGNCYKYLTINKS